MHPTSAGSRKWAVLAVLSAALALVSLDNTIVNVALPTLQEDLGATTSQLQWVVDAYSVLFAGTLLLAGSLGDRFGRRLMLIIGLGIFILASTLAALAPNADALTLARALMGIGGAFIMPSTLSILVQVFTEPKERGHAIGIWAAVAGVGVALGPIVGGLLLEHFTWHAIFWVNPPISILVVIASLLLVPESADETKPQLDPLGGLLSAVGLIALVFTIIEIPDSGISTVTVSSAVIALVFLGGFVWWEGKAKRPMLPMSLFRERLFTTAILIVGLVYFALMGAMFFLPQFLQLVQGMSPLQSGIALLPGAGGLLIASLFSPRLSDRWGSRRVIVLGLTIVILGFLGLAFISATTGYAYTGVSLGLVGLGLGLTLPQATNGVLAAVPRERAGVGSAVNDAVGELGGSFGVAILGGVMAVFYRGEIDVAITAAGNAVKTLPSGALEAARESLAAAVLESARLAPDVGEVFRAVSGQAFVSGMTWALSIATLFVLGGLVLAWRLFPRHVERVEE